MVGKTKHDIEKSIMEAEGDWVELLPQVLYGYRRRDLCPTPSPFNMMYGINPKMLPSDAVALLADGDPHHSLFEMFFESCLRATAVAESG